MLRVNNLTVPSPEADMNIGRPPSVFMDVSMADWTQPLWPLNMAISFVFLVFISSEKNLTVLSLEADMNIGRSPSVFMDVSMADRTKPSWPSNMAISFVSLVFISSEKNLTVLSVEADMNIGRATSVFMDVSMADRTQSLWPLNMAISFVSLVFISSEKNLTVLSLEADMNIGRSPSVFMDVSMADRTRVDQAEFLWPSNMAISFVSLVFISSEKNLTVPSPEADANIGRPPSVFMDVSMADRTRADQAEFLWPSNMAISFVSLV